MGSHVHPYVELCLNPEVNSPDADHTGRIQIRNEDNRAFGRGVDVHIGTILAAAVSRGSGS